MSGVDDWIAGLSEYASIGVVLFVAVLLGLRHATDPDPHRGDDHAPRFRA